MSTTKKKVKLRTVSDIISRIRWDDNNQYDNDKICTIGYDDRVHGPLEKPLDDYVPISRGGDIPEHRIWYVRFGNKIVWDKIGRVDRLFASGNGDNAPISDECISNVKQAKLNMERLALERKERQEQKERERARRARKRLTVSAEPGPYDNASTTAHKSHKRFQWLSAPIFRYIDHQWLPITARAPSDRTREKLVFLTWNVLFDLFEDDHLETERRWSQVVDHLQPCNAHVIALQEVTPEFVKLLLASTWVQKNYIATCSLDDTSSVTPSGNLLLWNREYLSSKLVEVCIDGHRQRIILAVLEHGDSTYTIANVHLPANHGERQREIARQRELAVVLARLQRLEAQFSSCNTIPVLMGDFNSGEEVLISGDVFIDVWRKVHPESQGLTFDPQTNHRSATTLALTGSSNPHGKRLDRIFIRRSCNLDSDLVDVSLVGCTHPSPSDHYGVRASIRSKQIARGPCMYKPKALEANAWAANAALSPHTLLGVVLGQSKLRGRKLFDSKSTLTLPHLTLLHGFIEYEECTELLTQALSDVVDATLRSTKRLSLRFGSESVRVFEHRASATLVFLLDMSLEENHWLTELYNGLKKVFPQCHEQESRFVEGWQPHVSLGTFGTTSEARVAAISTVAALGEQSATIDIHGLAAFKMSSDGRSYMRAVVPLTCTPKVGISKMPKLLAKGGRPWKRAFLDVSAAILMELERLVREIAGDMQSQVIVHGSCALGAALPGISDVDIVIEIVAEDDESLKSREGSFLEELSGHIRRHYPDCNIRFRNAEGDKLRLLTVKFWPTAPVLDIMLSCKNGDIPISMASTRAQEGIIDTEVLLDKVGTERMLLFEDSLRIIKLWAHRRQVYGLGYLGGGGWAIWLAEVLGKTNHDGLSPTDLVTIFFCNAAIKINNLPVHVSLGKQEEMKTTTTTTTTAPLCLVAANMNTYHGRNTTSSTIHTMQQELQRATDILQSKNERLWAPPPRTTTRGADEYNDDKLSVIMFSITSKSFSEFESVIIIKVNVKGACVADVKARGSNQLLSMLVALENKIGDPALIRPLLRPLLVRNCILTWFVGVRVVSKEVLHSFVHQEAIAFESAMNGLLVGDDDATMVKCTKGSDVALSLSLFK